MSTSFVRTVVERAINTARHSFYIAAPVVTKYFADKVAAITNGELSENQRGAAENLKYINYIPAVSLTGNFVAGFSKVSKIQDPELSAREKANHVAEYSVYALEMGTSAFALSYGLDPKTFLPMFAALDFIASGEDSLIDNLQSGLADVICASHLVGDCGNTIGIDAA